MRSKVLPVIYTSRSSPSCIRKLEHECKCFDGETAECFCLHSCVAGSRSEDFHVTLPGKGQDLLFALDDFHYVRSGIYMSAKPIAEEKAPYQS
jgi:hypothetical protein